MIGYSQPARVSGDLPPVAERRGGAILKVGTFDDPTLFVRLLHLFQLEPTGLLDLHEHEYKR
jgi:hypothetical protein